MIIAEARGELPFIHYPPPNRYSMTTWDIPEGLTVYDVTDGNLYISVRFSQSSRACYAMQRP